jgi:hypothetical protein
MTNGQSENARPEAAQSPYRHSVVLRNPQDPPFSIDPKSILAVFAVTTLEDRQYLKAAEGSLNDFNRFCQPRLWSAPIQAKYGAFACSAAPDGQPNVNGIIPALEKMGILPPFSIVVNTLVISFNNGHTKSKILAGFAFKEEKPRILFPGNDGCIPI